MRPTPGCSPTSSTAPARNSAGSCRIVVAGSYHAAVFALAQGVPVVGVSASPYYEAKFGGLAELFPNGCRVVSALHVDFGAQLAKAVDEAWEAAEALSPGLLAAARRQIAAGDEAYARFAERVSRHVGTSAALSRAPG
jgi:polysaccharide pyruvyl transferase WcaK-like protein